MKIVRSKKPLIYDGRNAWESIISLQVTDWTYDNKKNIYKAVVIDSRVIEVASPEPGTDLKQYIPFNQKEVTYKATEIDALFTQIGEDILASDSYTQKLKTLINSALLIVTQQKPIYGSLAEDWEIVDTSTEIAPEQ